jgi:FtsP/CotA-like multicopper oxidase with cupredoxin domain
MNGKREKLELIAMDGYPLRQTRKVDTILLPPGGRAEFIVEAAASGGFGQLWTEEFDTGPAGNQEFTQVLAEIAIHQPKLPKRPGFAEKPAKEPAKEPATPMNFDGMELLKPTAERKIFFSEELGGTNVPTKFFVTVEGQEQKSFDMNEKPVITTHVGAVEDWTIENRTLEVHDFHIHQIHFQLLEVDDKPVADPVMLDSITIPYWDGKSPYHRVKVRMDFRNPNVAGTSLFHCHILLHEDFGMMHKILIER